MSSKDEKAGQRTHHRDTSIASVRASSIEDIYDKMQDFSFYLSFFLSSFYSSGVLVDPTLIIHVTQPAIRQPWKYSWGICFRCTGTGCVSIYFIYRLLFSIDSSSLVDLWIFLWYSSPSASSCVATSILARLSVCH